MPHPERIRKVLVVLSPDLVDPAKPCQSMLLRRARDVAKNTGCELELFHVCFNAGIDNHVLLPEDRKQSIRRQLIDRDATMLAEIAARMSEDAIDVRSDVCWDEPRSDAILRKTIASEPDIVMKHMRDHTYILGIASNTDWDLARKTPAHLWLVNDGQEEITTLLAAVGNKLDDDVDITTGTDHVILSAARAVADSFSADICPVNAYETPYGQNLFAAPNGVGMAVVPATDDDKEIEAVREKHESVVRALSDLFRIDPQNAVVAEGNPVRVISRAAEERSANLIVLGARNIGRFERIVSDVTVEPVMSKVDCDILIARDTQADDVAKPDIRILHGQPRYDLERAISDPAAVFESPEAVADLSAVSIRLRERILQAWEFDIRAQMNEENEGGPPLEDIEVDALGEIRAARQRLAEARENDDIESARLSAGSR